MVKRLMVESAGGQLILSPGLKDALEHDWFYLNQANYVLFKKASDAKGFKTKLDQLREKYIVKFISCWRAC